MKATLDRDALRIQGKVPGYDRLLEQMECDAEVEGNDLILRIPLIQKKDTGSATLNRILEYLRRPSLVCDVDTMAQALEVEDA